MNINKYFYIITCLTPKMWLGEDGCLCSKYEPDWDLFEQTRQAARGAKADYPGSSILKFENKHPYKFLGVVS